MGLLLLYTPFLPLPWCCSVLFSWAQPLVLHITDLSGPPGIYVRPFCWATAKRLSRAIQILTSSSASIHPPSVSQLTGCQCELNSIYFNSPKTNQNQFDGHALSLGWILPSPINSLLLQSWREPKSNYQLKSLHSSRVDLPLSIYLTVPKQANQCEKWKPMLAGLIALFTAGSWSWAVYHPSPWAPASIQSFDLLQCATPSTLSVVLSLGGDPLTTLVGWCCAPPHHIWL